jgi:hypothetical protein
VPRAPRVSLPIRAWALVLCLLAASPLTAPFSTLNINDLFDGDGQPRPAAALQLKTAKDQTVSDFGSTPIAAAFLLAVDRPAGASTPPIAPTHRTHSILRL